MSDDFKKLEVWRLGISLVKEVYLVVRTFPKEETYILGKQVKEVAISVPSNIAEGSLRRHPKEFVRFINIARASLGEVETQLIIAQELGFISDDVLGKITTKIISISKMLIALRKSIEKMIK